MTPLDPTSRPEAAVGSRALLTPDVEAQAFWRMRSRMIATTLQQALDRSRLRVTLVAGLSLLFWVGLYALFWEGFRFLDTAIGHQPTHERAVHTIYNVFFASLMLMLMLSSGIILYSGLYCSSEAGFLLTTPARPERVVLHKFQEAIVFSSWGFLLLGSPMLLAYGVQSHAPWYYYVLLLPFMFAYIYIPGSFGAVLCLLLVHRVPRVKLHLMSISLLVGALLTGFVVWSFFLRSESNLLTPLWFQEMLSRLQVSEQRLLPSWWLSSGLLEAANHDPPSTHHQHWAESLMFLCVLISNALMCHLLIGWTARSVYRSGYSELHGERTARKPRRLFWLDRLVMIAPFLKPQLRLLIVKDLRVFRRDPVQWSQFLIFFGLLGLYFLNIRRFSYDVDYTGWVNMISFLNLAVVGLILSTFTTRFIFPMISLEGRRFWILGLLPISRESILWGKFLFAAVGSCIPCLSLIFLSDFMLRISTLVLFIHQITCLLLCLGLSGIAVGLGAKMPDLREQSPSKIAAGFGGTLNLVLSAIYIVAVVLLTALPCHFYLAAEHGPLEVFWLRILIAGALAAVLIGLLATFVPLWIGLRAFRELEL